MPAWVSAWVTGCGCPHTHARTHTDVQLRGSRTQRGSARGLTVMVMVAWQAGVGRLRGYTAPVGRCLSSVRAWCVSTAPQEGLTLHLLRNTHLGVLGALRQRGRSALHKSRHRSKLLYAESQKR